MSKVCIATSNDLHCGGSKDIRSLRSEYFHEDDKACSKSCKNTVGGSSLVLPELLARRTLHRLEACRLSR